MVVKDEDVLTTVRAGFRAEGAQRNVVFHAAADNPADISRIDVLTLAVFQPGIDPGEDSLAAVATVPAFVAEAIQDDVLEVFRCPSVVVAEDVKVRPKEEVVSKIDGAEFAVAEGVADLGYGEFRHDAGSDNVLILIAKGLEDVLIDHLRALHFFALRRAVVNHRW